MGGFRVTLQTKFSRTKLIYKSNRKHPKYDGVCSNRGKNMHESLVFFIVLRVSWCMQVICYEDFGVRRHREMMQIKLE